MALDPHTEDFQRLSLRYASSLDAADPFTAVRSFADFGRRFAQNRDALPQSDQDRAFHLVVRATDLIDYQLPFASDAAAKGIIDSARKLLEEAVDLDASCHDARRMLAAADNPSFEDYYRFLADGEAEVRAACEQSRDAVDLPEPGAAHVAGQLAMRPYVRWLAALGARALECGHYRKSVDVCRRLLDVEGGDPAGGCLTLALAYAKLEDEHGLDELLALPVCAARPTSPWFVLARIALAYKARDFDSATGGVRSLLEGYPRAGMTLAQQDWLPDGVYARIVVKPYSEDELILAVSEATVILQEGCDSRERGALGSWISRLPEVVATSARDAATEASPKAGAGAAGRDASEGDGE